MVWEVVSEYLKGVDVRKVAAYEWLVGCASIVDSEKKEGVDPVVRMGRINLLIAAQIASECFCFTGVLLLADQCDNTRKHPDVG